MTIQKAHWNTEGDNVRLSMPFNKVDKERRIVSGFATLDNLDKQNDIVTPEASLNAFSKFRGNIREMHQPLAVGKMVSFKEDKFFDPETKKMYSGIYVSAYVSKGAQDTWEKVLDGTLSGFSIGGKMNKWDDGYDEKMDSKVRIIKDYDLVELSLVDTPANQFANILSVEKVDGVDVVKGMDTVIENVFWDSESGLVLLSENETEISPTSGVPMQNIGFVEKSDNEKTEMLKFLVDSAKGIKTSKITKEESPMTDATNEVVEETTVETVEVAPEADAVVEEAVSEEVTEEAPVVEEVTEEAPAEEAEEVSPADDETEKTLVVNAVSEIKDTLTSAFSDLASIVKSLQAQVDELNKSIDSVKTEVKESKDVFNEFGKRVDAVEADTAFRKSGDIGDVVQFEPEQVQKSLWDGRFLKTTDLFK
jgi:outer membrane murein-binding lipoprotein Lpp